MTEVKFSVIIPVYNVEPYLSECLESVLNQNVTEIEIICIEDQSTDNSKKILETFAARDNRVKIIEHSQNLGIGAARNTGLRKAEGEFLLFLDGDDFFMLNVLGEVYQTLKRDRLEILQFDYIDKVEDEAGRNLFVKRRQIPKFNSTLWNSEVMDGPSYLNFTVKNRRIRQTLWTYAFQRKFLNEYQFKFLDISAHEDGEYVLKSLFSCSRIKMMDMIVYGHRRRRNSLIINPTIQSNFEGIFACKQIVDFFANQNLNQELSGWLVFEIRRRLTDSIRLTAQSKAGLNQMKLISREIKQFRLERFLGIGSRKRQILFRLLKFNFYIFVMLIAIGSNFNNNRTAPLPSIKEIN